MRHVERIRTTYDPKTVFDSFTTHYRRFFYGDLDELQRFIDKLRTGAVHAKLHEQHPTIEALAAAMGV